MEFDFDHWSRLSGEDPQAFERARLEAVDALIAQAPPEQRTRLRALQSRIDLERRRAGHPLGACVRISRMMWSRLDDLQHALDDLRAQFAPRGGRVPRPLPASARVLPFPVRR